MIVPSPQFLQKFKDTPGALSVAESIAIMNISSLAPEGGIWCEGGTHKGKSAMSALLGAQHPVEFHLIDTEFEKTIPTYLVSNNLRHSITKGATISFIIERFLDYLKKTDLKFSFVFSDAGEHDDEVLEEMKLLEDRIVQNGIICVHDFRNQFTAVERAYNYLLSTGKYEEILIDWNPILDHVRENNLEEGNTSWHVYPELPHSPNFVGALRRK